MSYGLNLNPIEYLWKSVKEEFSLKYYDDVDTFRQKISFLLGVNIMDSRYDLLIKTIERCTIKLEECVISDEIALKEVLHFLASTMEEKKHSSAFFLHTGSVCYDAVVFVLCVLANIIFDENDAVENATTLEKGTKVSYGKKRWKYEGLYKGTEKIYQGKYVLRGEGESVKYVSEKALSEILPYYGASEKMSGKGVKTDKSKRVEFMGKVLNLKKREIVALPRTSTVIYMDNEELDYLLNEVGISFHDVGKEYKITDLVTVTYYTLKKEYRKEGNASNNEPAIKVTNSMERARELVMEGEDNEILGFVACKNDVYRESPIDFEGLFKRRRLRYAWLISKLEYSRWIEAQLDDENQDIKVLAFSKEMLKTFYPTHLEDNRMLESLWEEISAVADRKYKGELVKSDILWSDYKRIKGSIYFIMGHAMGDDNAIQFCKWVYYMLRFYDYAFFTMQEYESFQKEWINEDIKQQFEIYRFKISLFENLIKDEALEVLSFIEKLYAKNETYNAKQKRIKRYIFENQYQNVMFVIPSMKFKDMLREYIEKNMRFKQFQFTIVTETKVKSIGLEKYDVVIFIALMNDKKVNPVDLIGARESVVFLYDSQIRLYKKIARDYEAYIKKLNERNPFALLEDDSGKNEWNRAGEEEERQIQEETEQDASLQEKFMGLFLQTEKYQASEYFGSGKLCEKGLDAYRCGQFVSGEHIIFTKGYEAYVIDSIKGEVVEKKAENLEAGDRLVFTVNDDKTKDIVDELLLEVCRKNEEVQASYQLVNRWKDKFREKREEKNWTYGDIENLFHKAGCDTMAQTIRQWLDLQSHIVGPREKEMFLYVGRVIGDSEIEEHYLKYAKATSEVRSVRVKILKLIETVVVDDINGVKHDDDERFGDIIERIREIAVIKQLENIETIDTFKVRFNRANRPLEN